MKKINKMIEEVEALDDNFKISKDILLIRLKDCKEELDKQLTLTDVSHRRELLSEYENFKLIKQDLLQSRNEFINEFLKERNCG